MFCTTCGSRVDDGARFCWNCGGAMVAPSAAGAPGAGTPAFPQSAVPAPAGPVGGYPVRLTILQPPRQSRILNSPLFIGSLIRVILVIPHLIALYFVGIGASLAYFLATFAILFSGTYPRGLWNFYLGYARWNAALYGYVSCLYDKYPKFSLDPVADYDLSLEADYPERHSRLLNFPLFGPLIKLILALPHYVVLFGLGVFAFVVLLIAQFVVLFTGAMPGGMYAYLRGVFVWSQRVSFYQAGLTDKYPPFSLQ